MEATDVVEGAPLFLFVVQLGLDSGFLNPHSNALVLLVVNLLRGKALSHTLEHDVIQDPARSILSFVFARDTV